MAGATLGLSYGATQHQNRNPIGTASGRLCSNVSGFGSRWTDFLAILPGFWKLWTVRIQIRICRADRLPVSAALLSAAKAEDVIDIRDFAYSPSTTRMSRSTFPVPSTLSASW